MKQKLFLLIGSISFFSCSQERLTEVTYDTLSVDEVSATTQSLLIDKDAVSLTSVDAKNVAALFLSKNGGVSSRSASVLASESTSVETILDSTTSEPLLYVINWANDGGFVVVSASKKCFPVACYSETGNFSLDADPASKLYIEEYKQLVRDGLSDTSDSLRNLYSLEWSLFEKSEGYSQADSRATTEVQSLIDAEIAAKTALGYTYIGTITAAEYYLPEDDYEALILDISTHTDPEYDYEEVSLFFIESYEYLQEIDPLMGTEWSQGEPFNVDASNKLAGCVPIAVGQIVYYHKYPEDRYDWDEMTSVYSDAFEDFILDIRDLCNVEYKSDATSATYDDAYNAFTELGYSASKDGTPTSEKLRTAIKAYNPVFIVGTNSDTGKGHAWVCEGYENVAYQGVISMLASDKYSLVSVTSTTYSDYPVTVYPPSTLADGNYGEYFYMNMGWGGCNNGWYRSNSYNASDSDRSFTTDQKIITVEK